MKKSIIAAAALAFATTAGAQSTYNEQYNVVQIPAESGPWAFLVTVLPQNDCDPVTVLVGQGANPNKEIEYRARIDRHGTWRVGSDIELSDDRTLTYMSSMANPEMITELRRGNTLRLQLPLMKGGHIYLSFSLKGFSRAIGKAKAACIKPSKYFEEPAPKNSNAEYFL